MYNRILYECLKTCKENKPCLKIFDLNDWEYEEDESFFDILKIADEKYHWILVDKFLHNKTLRQIASKSQYSHEIIRQQLCKALRQIKRRLQEF